MKTQILVIRLLVSLCLMGLNSSVASGAALGNLDVHGGSLLSFLDRSARYQATGLTCGTGDTVHGGNNGICVGVSSLPDFSGNVCLDNFQMTAAAGPKSSTWGLLTIGLICGVLSRLTLFRDA